MRPGEKLYEELHTADEITVETSHRQISAFTGVALGGKHLLDGKHLLGGKHLADGLRALRQATEARNAAGVVMCLKELVADYNPSSSILRQAFRQPALVSPMQRTVFERPAPDQPPFEPPAGSPPALKRRLRGVVA
jgi:hypothetical protein